MSKKKEPVEIVVIADRSGSMASIVKDAIGGYNAFLAEQQKNKGAANLTLAMFDHEYLSSTCALTDAKPLNHETFVPRGMTALHDAIGRALSQLEAKGPAKAIICILTDGQENSSREFNAAQIKEKITAAGARGWKVVYLAANQDAFAVGSKLGVMAGNTMNFAATGAGINQAYSSVTRSVTDYRN